MGTSFLGAGLSKFRQLPGLRSRSCEEVSSASRLRNNLSHWTKPFSLVPEDGLKPTRDNNAFLLNDGLKNALTAHTRNRRTSMKRPLLMVVFLTLACAATLAPIRSTPPMLLSDAGGADWKCSRSALILTTCAPSRDVRLTSVN